MSDDIPTQRRTNESQESAEYVSADIVELRLPTKTEYLPVVRAAVGVIAGGMSFDYDQIIQLRAAVAAALELTVQRARGSASQSPPPDLTVRFTITPDQLEILVPAPQDAFARSDSPEEVESEAFIASLVDEVDLEGEVSEVRSIRLIKYRPDTGK